MYRDKQVCKNQHITSKRSETNARRSRKPQEVRPSRKESPHIRQLLLRGFATVGSDPKRLSQCVSVEGRHFTTSDVHESVHCDTTMKITKTCTIYRLIKLLFQVSSTCFGRCFRPSPGALDCIYSIW
jgi:hypothetical protein